MMKEEYKDKFDRLKSTPQEKRLQRKLDFQNIQKQIEKNQYNEFVTAVRQVGEMTEEIEKKNEKITNLSERASTQEKQLFECLSQISQLKAQLGVKEGYVQKLTQTVEDQEKRNVEIERSLQEKVDKIVEMQELDELKTLR